MVDLEELKRLAREYALSPHVSFNSPTAVALSRFLMQNVNGIIRALYSVKMKHQWPAHLITDNMSDKEATAILIDYCDRRLEEGATQITLSLEFFKTLISSGLDDID